MAVVAGGDQAIQGDIVDVLQNLDGMNAARILALDPHVRWKVLALRTGGAGCRERPVVGVLDPPAARVEQRDRLFDRMRTVPLDRGIAAVHRPSKIEFRVAPGNEISMEV